MIAFTKGARVNVAKLIVGATIGGLATVVGLVLVLHIALGDGTFADAQRLIVWFVIQIVVMMAIMARIQYPGARKHLTWAAAMAGAVLVAGLSLMAFGQVAHEWINFADSSLGWGRRDLIALELPVLPFDISRMAVRDIIAAGLYTNSFAAACAMFMLWQRRHDEAEAREAEAEAPSEPVPGGTSAFGRPVTKQA